MTWFDTLTDDQQAKGTEFVTGPKGETVREYAGDNAPIGFLVFLATADRLCRRHTWMSIFDLVDWTWRDAYDDGMRPGEAVAAAIQYDREG